MWTLIIFAVGTLSYGQNTMSTMVGTITGFASSMECLRKQEEVEKTPGMYARCVKQ